MNGDVTVREVMTREYVGASEGDTLEDTARLMLEEDVEGVVVLRGSEPVGLLSERDVLREALEGDLAEMAVADAMRPDPRTVEASESLATATDLMSGTSTRHLLVMDQSEPIGMISEHDVVTASSLNPNVNGEYGADPETEAMVTETVGAQAETTAVDEEYSSQGICEVCGAMTRDLSTFNGQLVCSDCKDV